MKLGVEERAIPTQCGSMTITVVSVPATIQANIAKGLELGPQALATMYHTVSAPTTAGVAEAKGEKK